MSKFAMEEYPKHPVSGEMITRLISDQKVVHLLRLPQTGYKTKTVCGYGMIHDDGAYVDKWVGGWMSTTSEKGRELIGTGLYKMCGSCYRVRDKGFMD